MFYSSDDRLLDEEAIKKLENEKYNINLIKRVGTSHKYSMNFQKNLK